MNEATRRGFLSIAGVTAAAGAAVVLAPGASAAPSEEQLSVPADAAGSMIAYVHDVQKGEVVLMIDGRDHLVTDKQLVARLARAFANAAKA